MRPRVKFWLETPAGEYLMGPGLYRLLRAVAEHSSLKEGARRIGVSYRKAWEQVREAEARLGFALLRKHSGGESGGGSELTPEAQALLGRYAKVVEGLERVVREQFAQAFEPVE
ncbi:Molybdenum-pterin-binding protein MopA [Calidithermus terrae]|uniref:Molybdenum-pterin-binding protein MopA n=1 Tax=Calidithermus terrae TaxID=1408545 RepID=A0A399EJG2_9DEIN|nr:LysR family transcriptional regulator [Calidithermus terrae]RIH82291.1 Molybdenum-pterin-binding protein MopA [Calidithermus terrae]